MSVQSWQRCPICNGTGIDRTTPNIPIECKTCKGQKIINTITGKPPASGVTNLTPLKSYPEYDG